MEAGCLELRKTAEQPGRWGGPGWIGDTVVGESALFSGPLRLWSGVAGGEGSDRRRSLPRGRGWFGGVLRLGAAADQAWGLLPRDQNTCCQIPCGNIDLSMTLRSAEPPIEQGPRNPHDLNILPLIPTSRGAYRMLELMVMGASAWDFKLGTERLEQEIARYS
ncbi:hypothetical protein NDU88_000428 [Pleurodeles waltl]|uniref:Uncharacterized protein n=1 Tax=Pleurodeles waltl TaxID=8319 RepID=A0AAV7TF44_PLEWA|nr:hypothetical protein NDU88_000428 [Pleurodeles waltl]